MTDESKRIGPTRARVLALSAAFAAMTAAGGLISIPLGMIPFTMQTFFIYLGVLVLKKDAFLGVTIYLAMGLAGLPVFANGLSGYAVLLSPLGGFILGFLAGSAAAGALVSRLSGWRWAPLSSLLLCAAIVFAAGWLWLALWMGGDLMAALWAGVLPFLPGDAVKIVMALAVGRRLNFGRHGSGHGWISGGLAFSSARLLRALQSWG
jgi:biotin transport system substrate-specific component